MIRNRSPMLAKVPMLAVTASANSSTRTDIIKGLHMRDPVIHSMCIDRSNIFYEFRAEESAYPGDEREIWLDLRRYVRKQRSAIVYVLTVATANFISTTLQKKNVKCESYHAKKKTTEERTEILKRFMENDLRVVVATVAFWHGCRQARRSHRRHI